MTKNLRSLLLLVLVGWGTFSSALAQTAPPSNLSGSELRTWLRQNWYDGKRVVLDYGTARGKMYNYIDNYNNSVVGVYSGYVQPFPYSETSTSTSIPNLNTEHTVPQSWFNEAERMRTDIHHLFPTVIQWNSDRGSDPFAEIPDAQTRKWIINMTSQSTIPTSNIDAYSEDTDTQFEPREVHKGNLARAIFYFYTMHEGQTFDPGKGVISAVGDMQTLYQWHLQDPVDERELERNRRIERVQGNRNPYIDYPDLVASAYGFAPVNCSPTTQISNLSISEATQTSFQLNWTNGNGNRRLIVVREGTASSFSPSGNYATGVNSNFTQATDQGNGHKIVYSGLGNSVTVTGLTATQTYYVQAFEFCNTDNSYNTTSAPATQVSLPGYTCSGAPSQQTSNLVFSNITTSGFNLAFTGGNGDGRLIVVKEGGAPTSAPQTGTAYSNANANFSSAPALADGSKVVYSGNGNNVTVMGLRSNTTYSVVAYESCSNGFQYATGTAALQVQTLVAGGNLPEGAIARQDFENGADDGWEVVSGFSSSDDNSGTPNGQRIKSGLKSFQLNPATSVVTTAELVFAPINTTDYADLVVELFNSSISKSTGNGMDAGDFIEVYVARNGAAFSATPDAKITASATNNVRYGMNGTGVVETTAGTPVVKTIEENGDISGDAAPSRVLVRVPNGTTSVQVKVVVRNNAANEVLNIDDVSLYGNLITGIPAELDHQLVLYPNPSTGLVTIKSPTALPVQEVRVISMVGQEVFKLKLSSKAAESHTINLSSLPKGLYIIQLKTAKGTLLRRVVIQ